MQRFRIAGLTGRVRSHADLHKGCGLPRVGARGSSARGSHGVTEDSAQPGLWTWASLEPVIDPEQTLELIRATAEYVDLYKVGKLNHRPEARDIDWRDFVERVVGLLDELGKERYIKVDLRRYLSED